MSLVVSLKSTLKPQDDPRYITTPIRKNTFNVPTELNLVKKVGDFMLTIGNKININNGAVFLLKNVLFPESSNIVSLVLQGDYFIILPLLLILFVLEATLMSLINRQDQIIGQVIPKISLYYISGRVYFSFHYLRIRRQVHFFQNK